MAQARRGTKPPSKPPRRADATGRPRERSWASIERELDREARARERESIRESERAWKEAERERRAQAREEARLQREAHKADLKRQRAREARERKRAARERERAKEAARKAKERAKREAKREAERRKRWGKPDPDRAFRDIGKHLGSTPSMQAWRGFAGRWIRWTYRARYDLPDLLYAELYPMFVAIEADDRITHDIGALTLARMVLTYTGPREQGGRDRITRDWTPGETTAWYSLTQRMVRLLDPSDGDSVTVKYYDTTVSMVEIWVSSSQADESGLW